MGKFKDIFENAFEKGILLDSCGLDTRDYNFGLYTDLCGMSYEDALKSKCCCGSNGGDNGGSEDKPSKIKNEITFTLEQDESAGDYVLTAVASKPLLTDVEFVLSIDGTPQTITLPAGQLVIQTDIRNDSPYADVEVLKMPPSDETYEYSSKVVIDKGIRTVTFKVDGEEYNTIRLKIGVDIPYPEMEEKTGYDFAWNSIIAVMPDENIVINGYYTIHTWKLTFIVETEELDGTYASETFAEYENVEYNSLIQYPSVEKEGFTATQWDMQTTNPTMPDNDLEVKCQLLRNEYTVTFHFDNGDDDQVDTYKFGTAINSIDDPEKLGYAFKSWEYKNDDETIDKPENMPSYNIDAYALWEVNKYMLYVMYSLNGNDYQPVETFELEYGAPIAIEQYEEEGYTFKEWQKEASEGVWETISELPQTMGAENLTIASLMEINTWELSVNVLDSEDNVLKVYTESVAYNEPLQEKISALISNFDVKDGYTLTVNTADILETMPNADYSVDYIYKPMAFSMALVLNVEDEEPRTVLYTKYTDDKVSVSFNLSDLNIENAEYYTFNGYEYDSEKDITIETDGEGVKFTMPASDVTFKLGIVKKVFTITHNINKEVYSNADNTLKTELLSTDELTGKYNTIVTYPEHPEMEGYTLEQPDHMDKFRENVTIDDYYRLNQYDIRFICKYEGTDTAFYDSQDKYKLYFGQDVAYPTIENIPVGYQLDENWEPSYTEMPSENVITVIKLKKRQFNLQYFVQENDGIPQAVGEKISVTFGDNLNYDLSQFAREGYTVTARVEGFETMPLTMPAQDINVIVKQTVNEYTISYFVDGNTTPVQFTLKFGSAVTPYTATITGKDFVGYYSDASYATEMTIPTTMPSQDVNVYMKYEDILYTVTFDFEDGNDPVVKSYKIGDSIAAESAEKEGYTFNGWLEENGTQLPSTMPNRNITVKPSFTVNTYKLTIKKVDEDGNALVSDVVVDNVEFNASLDAYLQGYRDEIEKDGTTLVFTSSVPNPLPTNMPSRDLTIELTYAEQQESSTVYYFNIFDKDLDKLNDVNTYLNTSETSEQFDASLNTMTELVFVMPASDEYNEYVSKGDEYDAEGEIELSEEWYNKADEYMNAHVFHNVIAIPSTYLFNDAKVGGASIFNKFIQRNDDTNTVIINGSNYNVYTYTGSANAYKQVGNVKINKISITLEKK